MTRKVLTISAPKEQGVKVDDLIERLCGNCRFFNGSEMFPETGECRKRPPYYNQQKEKSFWPDVDASSWCGEFKRLPVEVA